VFQAILRTDAYYREECNRAIIDDRKFVIYSKEKDKILQYFAQNLGSFDKSYVDLQVHNTYQEQLAAFEKERSVKLNARFIATLTIFAISMFMLFFTMKSNIIKRAQEISVYRLMGIAKRSILSSFALEVIFITNYTVLPVVLGFSSILKLIAAIPSLRLTIVYPWTAMIVLLIFLYLVNIIVGILPVYSIVKLPPARIAEKST
jgi:ABC-type antimicrobial peptide transport system permease subunit